MKDGLGDTLIVVAVGEIGKTFLLTRRGDGGQACGDAVTV